MGASTASVRRGGRAPVGHVHRAGPAGLLAAIASSRGHHYGVSGRRSRRPQRWPRR
jgi:hypothetical protein